MTLRAGGGGVGQPRPTHAPTHIRKIFFRGKIELKFEIHYRGQKFEADFRCTNPFLVMTAYSCTAVVMPRPTQDEAVIVSWKNLCSYFMQGGGGGAFV